MFILVASEFPRHCNDFSRAIKPPKDSRVTSTIIQPDDGEPFLVYCEMNKFGGGWTRILRRSTERMTFHRDWYSYKNGFGDLYSDGWLGLEKIHRLTKYKSLKSAELLISLYTKESKWFFPEYKYFQVGGEDTKYQLYIGNFTGDGGDSLSYSHNARFSTYDRDHDSSSGNCASSNRGGWWYYIVVPKESLLVNHMPLQLKLLTIMLSGLVQATMQSIKPTWRLGHTENSYSYSYVHSRQS